MDEAEKLPLLGFVSPSPENAPEGIYPYGDTEIQIRVSSLVPDGQMYIVDQEAINQMSIGQGIDRNYDDWTKAVISGRRY